MTSFFKPKRIKDFKPTKFKMYTFMSGLKKSGKDLLVIDFERNCSFAAVYSKTSTPSAPIIWDKKQKNNLCNLLIVNSGNANAYTGNKGIESIKNYTMCAANVFQCNKRNIYVSSTGVIGEQIDPNKINYQLKKINKKNTSSLLQAAKAIMTTDTFPKVEIQNIKFGNKNIKIYGFAKGSGMIAPNMGTMLAYIFIESDLTSKHLKNIIKDNIDSTFNSISVDGDTSTSDTVMIFSIPSNNDKKDIIKNSLLKKISNGTHKVMLNLSKQIVSDGEGISKLIEVNIFSGKSKTQSKKVAFSIAESMLVKTAIAGEDANWGRIIMAIGKADKNIQQNKIEVSFGNLLVAKNGMKNNKINIKKLDQYMKNKIININVKLNLGKFQKTVWSSDLTYEYVKINKDYRS
tara:strand:- start:178 stop:1386 length:1209 start_codon:yes stop_codon:yes gene_type:complete